MHRSYRSLVIIMLCVSSLFLAYIGLNLKTYINGLALPVQIELQAKDGESIELFQVEVSNRFIPLPINKKILKRQDYFSALEIRGDVDIVNFLEIKIGKKSYRYTSAEIEKTWQKAEEGEVYRSPQRFQKFSILGILSPKFKNLLNYPGDFIFFIALLLPLLIFLLSALVLLRVIKLPILERFIYFFEDSLIPKAQQSLYQKREGAKWLIFLGLVVLAIMVDHNHFWDRIFWLDESTSYYNSFRFPRELFTTLMIPYEMQPFLFFFISSFLNNPDYSFFVFRLVPFSFFLILVAWAYWGTKREFSCSSRIILCLAIIYSQYGIRYATEYRPYSFGLLFVCVSSMEFIQVLKGRGSSPRYFILGLGLIYSLTMNLFTFFTQALFFFLVVIYRVCKKKNVKPMRPLFIVGLILAVIYGIYLYHFYQFAERNYGNKIDTHFLEALRGVFQNRVWGEFLDYKSKRGLVFMALALLGLLLGLKRRDKLVIFSILLFVITILGTTLALYNHYWINLRYLVGGMPALAMLTTKGAQYAFLRYRKLVTCGVLILLMVLFGRAIPKFLLSVSKPHPTVKLGVDLSQYLHKLEESLDTLVIQSIPSWIDLPATFYFRHDEKILFSGSEKPYGNIYRLEEAVNKNFSILLISRSNEGVDLEQISDLKQNYFKNYQKYSSKEKFLNLGIVGRDKLFFDSKIMYLFLPPGKELPSDLEDDFILVEKSEER